MTESGTAGLLQTPLANRHRELAARMVPFSGWEMPVQYPSGILAEHLHTRSAVSLFDICHMGEFRIRGKGCSTALDAIFPRPVSNQKPGSCRYNFLLSNQATVLDDLIIYRLAEDEFYIVVNAGTREQDAAVLRERLAPEIEFIDESAQTAKLDLQGPQSAAVLAQVGINTEQLPRYYHWINLQIAGIDVLLSRTGYTGELGFELYFNAEKAVELWDCLLSRDNVQPAGLGARDTLRLEMGYPLYGHELDDSTTPVEAGFAKMLKLDSDRDFFASNILRNAIPKKQLLGITLAGRRAARAGAKVFANDQEIGEIRSGTFSPSLEKAIALAYIDPEFPAVPGQKLELELGRQRLPGQISDLPFYRHGTVRLEI